MTPTVAPLAEELAQQLGAERVLTAPEDLAVYAYDGTAALRQNPACVVFPLTTHEVAACVQIARRHRAPIVTRGSGTGLSGGSVPMEGALVVCLNRMDRIIELDPRNLTIEVEAGVVTQTIDEAAGKHGLFYPPDPGSRKISTIGGNVAENSGGLRGLKYGVTRDYVMGLEAVLASGEIVWLGNKCVKDVAGYNLRDLFIGSEGTLGIVTRVLLKLVPQPQSRMTMLASFASLEAAGDTVSDIIAAKIIPCTLEFLDQQTIRCVEDFTQVGLPTEAAAVLIMETDGHPLVVAEEAAAMAAIASARGAISVRTAADDVEANKLLTARRSAFSALARVRPTTILEDVTVPRSELAGMVAFIAASAAKHGLQIGTFGHMGDGNLHPTFLTDERNADEMHRVELSLGEIVDRTLAVGGTITGEHGVGLAKKPYLRQQLGDHSYQLLKLVKRALDPEGLLNPGKIFE
ncbi:FAD-binding oxidoreductase [Lacipirellula limnantheis]|uniref:Putative FAD-linked oxidoreductase n=1 Tax=Lacipirellula limnantheis TaxID=2528024 RepID=A0A517U3Q0_9BACT|nr:FAD-linked oxidase C-terminal domain-containing protein [Lacipirellula limnantheis]QDT75249.1 putative FAD-linked oxidoreductase [Lacipirellula limnantheis]